MTGHRPVGPRISPAPPDPANNPVGFWTLLATWLLAIAAGFLAGGHAKLWHGLIGFVTGQGAHLRLHVASPLELISATGATLAIAAPVACAVSIAIHVSLAEADNKVSKLFRGLGEQRYFQAILLTVLLEELFARWLFLGVIGHFWQGTLAVYVLFFAGNGLWALYHLTNYDEGKRNPLRVLSQFIMGAFLTVVFLQYGFMAALLVHFAFDALLFTTSKRQRWGRLSLKVAVYHLVVILGSLVGMKFAHTDLSLLGNWLGSEAQFNLPGWDVYDYLFAITLITSTIAVVLEVLAYDQDNLTLVQEEKPSGILYDLLGAAIIVLIAFGAFHLLGLVMANQVHRIIVISLAFMLITTAMSGSAMARSFWQALPGLFLTLSALVALGFWGALAFVLMRQVVAGPERAIIRRDISDSLLPAARRRPAAPPSSGPTRR